MRDRDSLGSHPQRGDLVEGRPSHRRRHGRLGDVALVVRGALGDRVLGGQLTSQVRRGGGPGVRCVSGAQRTVRVPGVEREVGQSRPGGPPARRRRGTPRSGRAGGAPRQARAREARARSSLRTADCGVGLGVGVGVGPSGRGEPMTSGTGGRSSSPRSWTAANAVPPTSARVPSVEPMTRAGRRRCLARMRSATDRRLWSGGMAWSRAESTARWSEAFRSSKWRRTTHARWRGDSCWSAAAMSTSTPVAPSVLSRRSAEPTRCLMPDHRRRLRYASR